MFSIVGDDVWGCYLQGLVHISKYGKWGCAKWKIARKKKGGMVLTVGDDVWGCCFQGPVHISKYGKWGCAKWKIALK
jgi:hypothetical protein